MKKNKESARWPKNKTKRWLVKIDEKRMEGEWRGIQRENAIKIKM